jgi:hypothetical protein
MIWNKLVICGTGGILGICVYVELILPFVRHREIQNNINIINKKIDDGYKEIQNKIDDRDKEIQNIIKNITK